MSGQHIRVTVRSAADPATVYGLLVDGAAWPTWSPLGSFELEREGDGGGETVGAIRVFRTGRKVSRERIVTCVPGEQFSYELVSGLAIDNYRADVRLRPDGTGTVIEWHTSFDSRVPGTGWLYRRALVRYITPLVHGLADQAATVAGRAG